MSLSSLPYLLFLGFVIVLSRLVPSKWQNHLLLAASVAFYALAMPAQTIVMLVYVGIIYLLSFCIRPGKKTVLGACLTLSLGMLFVCKYVNAIIPAVSIVAPIGVSYITFQCIAYCVEVSRGKLCPESRPVNFYLYALFFSKVTAGPIEDPGSFLAQLRSARTVTPAMSLEGVLLLCLGLVKKLVVADTLSVCVSGVYAAPASATGLAAILASILYAVQILCDFSGYTDLALGTGLLFGLELTENFDRPYLAVSIRDFWRRWHISLSTWLKNYVYIPLGGSRVSPARRYANVLLTFLVSGIWHGASLNFVVWGLLHGFYQVCGAVAAPIGERFRKALHISGTGKLHRSVSCVRTFALVVISWVFFRAASLQDAFLLLLSPIRNLGTLSTALSSCGLTPEITIVVLCGILFANLLSKRIKSSPGSIVCRKGELVVVLVGAMISVFLAVCAAPDGGSSFIYFDF